MSEIRTNELARLASLQPVATRRLPRVQERRPRRPWCARVRALQATRGGVHEPGEHRRTRSRQVHLSTARSRQRGRGGLSQEAAPRPAPRVPGHAPALHGGPGGVCERSLLGREIAKLGHTVRLIAPAYVKPFVKRQKNDRADAEAICEAAQRPTMRFVALKSANQQAAAVVFRTRDLLVRQRTQAIN